MVQISKDIIIKLDRMKVLGKKLSSEDISSNKLIKKYQEVQKEMVDKFMPLIEKLVDSGLLTVSIGEDDNQGESYLPKKYDNISGTASQVFENGNIWLHTTDISAADYRSNKQFRILKLH